MRWPVDHRRRPGLDLWAFDVRRFGRPHSVAGYLAERCVDAYANYYQVAYRTMSSRSAAASGATRCTTCWPAGALRSARSSAGSGPTGSASLERRRRAAHIRRSAAWPQVEAEHHAVRRTAGLIDMSSFSKFGDQADLACWRFCNVWRSADLDVAIGKIVYTQLLNERGGIGPTSPSPGSGTRSFTWSPAQDSAGTTALSCCAMRRMMARCVCGMSHRRSGC